jgi:hypothetical protein
MTMAEEGFLRRWARRKTETNAGIEPAPEPASEIVVESVAARAAVAEAVVAGQTAPSQPTPSQPIVLPTMDDVAQLTSESDFSAFVARGVDQAVRRSALKKLFADPHFNVMDKLDMYMDDYNVASPMSSEMLASLKHSKSFFDQAADEARKRAEAEARIAAGGGLEGALPLPAESVTAEPDAAVPALAPTSEDADDATAAAPQGRLAAVSAGSAEIAGVAERAELAEAPMPPPGAHSVAESSIMMQKQP